MSRTAVALGAIILSPAVFAQTPTDLVDGEIRLSNSLPPLNYPEDPDTAQKRRSRTLPIAVPAWKEHQRRNVSGPSDTTLVAIRFHKGQLYALADSNIIYRRTDSGDWQRDGEITATASRFSPRMQLRRHLHRRPSPDRTQNRPRQSRNRIHAVAGPWMATSQGLFHREPGNPPVAVTTLPARGVNDVAVDGSGTVWVATSLGLWKKPADSDWIRLRGRDGLPIEHTVCLALDDQQQLWIGTPKGVILHRPQVEERRWFYRAGPRYLPGDDVLDLAVAPNGSHVWVLTTNGPGIIDIVSTTLEEKAHTIEARINERHRRLGLVGETQFASVDDITDYHVEHGPNDGLWTAYHVAAMSLCYGATGNEAARASATRSMESLYMLQNATGIPGLPARSVVPREEGQPSDDWRLTPDETHWWYTDTSSDEIDGHYFAFYTFWEHIARHDDSLKQRHIQQVRDMTNYIVDHGYRLMDWNGERTRWGFWNPEELNENPMAYLENGLNSLQMLSFLKVARHITADNKFKQHYDSLILNHGYLNNVLLEKKVYPDQVNHSDDQLAYVAWYPILQLEQDPRVREGLQQSVRRHYRIEEPERASFFFMVTATIDPDVVDIEAAIENLKNIPTDRRNWRMLNSHRDDVTFARRPDRFGKPQLVHVLPADERHFGRWNANPYLADGGGDGTLEDNGSAWLLPYWMGRYHGLIAE